MNKKQLIMEKSIELFAKQGLQTTSIQEITNHCGISKGAFYLSFTSKDELILSLIDHFLKEVTVDIDRVVREGDVKDLPYNFYTYHFKNLSLKSDFAKVFLKEQSHYLSKELLEKIHAFAELIQQSTLLMLEKTYGNKIKEIKYDMVYTVQGLMNTYIELFLFEDIQLRVEELARSLTEKTDILVKYMSTPYITEDVYLQSKRVQQNDFTAAQLIDVLDEAIYITEAPIEKESLELLKEELINPSMNQAVIKGLIENIRQHPDGRWAAYLLMKHFQLEQ